MKYKLFNIYYLNLSKVYEMSMSLENKILTGITRENSNKKEKNASVKANASSKTGIINSNIESHYDMNISSTSNVVEVLDVKTTKSILLREILEKCIKLEDGRDVLNIGDLLYIDNLRLNLMNEKEIRAFKILRNDAIKGLNYEGLDLNNLIVSLLNDYSYKLTGSAESLSNEILIKIPMTSGSEFENLYTIDDLLIGNVSIVGIYRGKAKLSDIRNNLDSFTQNSIDNNKVPFEYEESDNKLHSRSIDTNSDKTQLYSENDSKEYDFIDVIAIIQNVKSSENYKQDDDKSKIENSGFFRKLFDRILRR